MKTTTVWVGLCQIILVGMGLTACMAMPATPPTGAPATALVATLINDNATNLTPTVDATATSAALVIAQALSATPGMTPTVLPVADVIIQATPTFDPVAMQTTEAQHIADAVAATLTAQPTTTPTARPPTATPNLDATQTSAAQQIATSVMATLMAQPTAILKRALMTNKGAACENPHEM